MTSEAAHQQLDPDTLARAQERASRAGMSLNEWLDLLMREDTTVPLYMPFPGSGSWLFTKGYAPRRSLSHESVLGAGEPWMDVAPPVAVPQVERSHSVNPALHLIMLFHSRIDRAAVLLSAAFVEAAVKDFRPASERHMPRKVKGSKHWYFHVLDTCLARSRDVQNALLHHWEPTPRADRLAMGAFMLLSELMPAGNELLRLCQSDRPRAFSELAAQLDVITRQVEQSAKLVAEVEASETVAPSNDERFAEIRAALLERAGGGLSLTEAANLLGVSRQALHKRIKTGTVLGMMYGPELVLPRAQFIEHDGKHEVVPKLGDVLKIFDVAGFWSALQFLIEPDPNLADIPLRALIAGRTEAVVHAARAYLGDDED